MDREGMLSIGKLGTGQETYYLEKVAEGAEDYYSGEGEAAGQWMGDGAAELGLSGEVGGDQLTAMLTGRSPADGSPLGLRAVGGRGPVPGFDLTFSAPKSVSLLWGLGGPVAGVEVNAAHRAAVDAALGYLQEEACWTRRGAGGAEFVKGSGYLAAAFEHRSSRNGDPQLHTHVLVANATKGPDGRWTRLYHPAIYEHAQTASYLYQAHLRHELTRRLGIEWQEVRRGIAEIEGFADEHLREFSTRRAEILEAAGPDASARSMEVAALTTRKGKEQGVSREELHERWRSRGEEIGLDREAISRTFNPEAILDPDSARVRPSSNEQVGEAVTAHASHFERRDVIQAVADSQRSGAPAAEVLCMANRFLASDEVLQVSTEARGERFTTQRIWELEREAISTAERMQSEPRGQAGELIAARVIQARPTLKADQREMVRRLLADPEGIAVVVGEAGTGKTFAIVAAAEGWAQAGYELRAVAPTWRAANVLRAEGLEATSVARLLAQMQRGDGGDSSMLNERTVLLVDEAGMVGSAHLAVLIEAADAARAKLVLVGDHQQLGEIEAGGLYRALAERTDPIVLDEVIRHNHEVDREAARMIREGEGRAALDLYRSAERVTVAPDAEARREAMVADWHRSYVEGQDALMVAKRNAEVERLNATARELLRADGQLGEQEIEVGEARFAVGDQVITRVNDHAAAIYNRERWRVAEVDAESRSIVLEGIDRTRRVEVGPDYLDCTTPHGEAPAIQHAYAVTTYCAQGTTVDRAFVMADPSMDKQELYVAASRSREETYLYATPEIQVERAEYAPKPPERDALGHVAEAAERDRAQTAAHDEALRSELRELPSEKLISRRESLAEAAKREGEVEQRHGEERPMLELAERRYENAVEKREAAEDLGWRDRRRELPVALEREDRAREELRVREGMRDRHGPLGDEARREREIARQVLAERAEPAILATRLSPPEYVLRELGKRPGDPTRAKTWDNGVRHIETYRHEYGITDTDSALGRRPEGGRDGLAHDRARDAIREAQRRLDRQQQLDRSMQRSHDAGRDMGMGIGH
jgi:conjugative relaxase-like TrwC/TraI family protein